MPKIESIIPNTCPDIDKAISGICSAQKSISNGLKNEDMSFFEDAENELRGIEDILEKLRSANSDLREYAQRFLDLQDSLECTLRDA